MSKRTFNRDGISAIENMIRRRCNREGKIAVYISISSRVLGSMVDDMERGILLEERVLEVAKLLDSGVTLHGDMQSEGDYVRAILEEVDHE